MEPLLRVACTAGHGVLLRGEPGLSTGKQTCPPLPWFTQTGNRQGKPHRGAGVWRLWRTLSPVPPWRGNHVTQGPPPLQGLTVSAAAVPLPVPCAALRCGERCPRWGPSGNPRWHAMPYPLNKELSSALADPRANVGVRGIHSDATWDTSCVWERGSRPAGTHGGWKWCLCFKEVQLLWASPCPTPGVRPTFQIFQEKSGVFKCKILQFLSVEKLKTTLSGPRSPFITFV